MNTNGPVVILEHLTKRYGTFTALDDVSLTLNSGQIFGLIGPNGAGKTTTLKAICGLQPPRAGKVGVIAARELSLRGSVETKFLHHADRIGRDQAIDRHALCSSAPANTPSASSTAPSCCPSPARASCSAA